MIKIKQKAALNFEKFLSFSILLKYLNSEEKVYCHLLPFLSHFQEPLARRKYEKPARPLAIFAVEKSNLFSSLSHFHFIHVCNTFLSFSRFFSRHAVHTQDTQIRALVLHHYFDAASSLFPSLSLEAVSFPRFRISRAN